LRRLRTNPRVIERKMSNRFIVPRFAEFIREFYPLGQLD
jgi:hypothetical protein